MGFMHGRHLAKIGNCPPEGVEPVERSAFRFVHADIADPRNFLCVALLQPNREFKGSSNACKSFGISLYDTQDHAAARFRKLKMNFPNIEKTLGGYLAIGTIRNKDGAASIPDGTGHFTLWQSDVSELESQFEILADLTQ